MHLQFFKVAIVIILHIVSIERSEIDWNINHLNFFRSKNLIPINNVPFIQHQNHIIIIAYRYRLKFLKKTPNWCLTRNGIWIKRITKAKKTGSSPSAASKRLLSRSIPEQFFNDIRLEKTKRWQAQGEHVINQKLIFFHFHQVTFKCQECSK